MTQIYHMTLPNGLHLLAQPMNAVRSTAMTMLVPGGTAYEPDDRQGLAAITAEMLARGAGGLSSREHSDALDRLGVQRGVNNQRQHMALTACMLAEHVPNALGLLLDMLMRPNLDPAGLEPSRALTLQALDSIEDEPQQKCMLEVRRRHLPPPLNRGGDGRREDVQRVTVQDVHRFASNYLRPQGAILAFAGALDWPAIKEQVERLTQAWEGVAGDPEPCREAQGGYHHLQASSAQVHIGLAARALPEPHPESLLQQVATSVLSGGMSCRLFTEVREKRGLVYAVSASCGATRDFGILVGYAGTTTPRAQETLNVLVQELRRLREGVTAAEFDRAIVGMKSGLVMQGESTSARAAAIAADLYTRGAPRTLEQIAAEVDLVTLEALNDFVPRYLHEPLTIVTLGPQALEPPA